MALTDAQVKKIKEEAQKYRNTKEGGLPGNVLAMFCLFEPLAEGVLRALEVPFPDAKPTLENIIKDLGDLKKGLCQ